MQSVMEFCPTDIADAVVVLVSPLTSCDVQKSVAASFDQLFTVNIRKLREFVLSSPRLAVFADRLTFVIEETPEYDVHWHFVVCNVQLLHLLCTTLTEITKRGTTLPGHTCHGAAANPETSAAPLSSDALSLVHRKAVSSALQFITGLGICPLLLPGVGVPLHRRSDLACRLLKDTTVHLSDCDKYHHLTVCIDILLDCIKQHELASVTLSAHLCDLLASLMQVCYMPLWKSCAAKFEETRSCRMDLGFICSHRNYLDELNELITQVPSSTLVRELLLLQSGCPPSPDGKVPPRPPAWLRKVCQSYLQQIISKPDGVLTVLASTVQGDDKSTIDSRKCDAAARIIIDCCQGQSAYKQHFSVLAPQILDLLRGSTVKGPVFRAVVAIAEGMQARDSDVAYELITKPLLEPLLGCLDSADITSLPVNTELTDEKTLTESVLLIHKVFVLNCAPQSPLLLPLQSVCHVLFHLYTVVGQSPSLLRKPVEELLEQLFISFDAVTGAKHLRQLCLDELVDFKPMHSRLRFTSGDAGGIRLVVTDDGCDDNEEWVNNADSVVELLYVLRQQRDLTAEFFLLCLQEMTSVVSLLPTLDELSVPSASCSSQACLLDIDARVERMTAVLRRNLSLLGVIAAVCDKFGGDCLQKTDHILRFAEATLERSVKQLETDHNSAMRSFENETLVMALGLLGALVADAEQADKINWDVASRLVPLLQHVADTHPDNAMKETAINIRVLIATHGRVTVGSVAADPAQTVSSAHASNDSCVEQAGGGAKSKPKPLIEVVSSSDNPVTEQPSSQSVPSEFETAMTEVADVLVPARGHALLTLRRLVESGDTAALSSLDRLLAVCEKNVDDPDSYVYLNAIQLLASLAARLPQQTLPWLADKYLAVTHSEAAAVGYQQSLTERRMKLGEVLVKTSSALGPLIPHYRSLLLGTCLRACKDPEPMIRASAVSNLGQVCQHLHFSLGSVMYEVFECIQALLKSDPDVAVKRSAAVCATLLLRGLSKDCLKVLGSLLHDFYKLLKHCQSFETDDVLRLHVQLAIDEIDIFMKEFLFPAPSMTKRIHVLDPLDVD